MEIITYVLDGTLEHRDSMGNHGVVHVGGVQYMSAGTGVLHSELAPACLLWDAIAAVEEPLARETELARFGEYAAAAIVLLTSPPLSD
jgi:redox-sensitive bicupin YhaK (pirin superfamily)